MNSTELLNALNWRYATKSFDKEKKLDANQLDTLLESLRLSPSSFGLQGRGFVVVENPELRQQLLPYARNQPQVVDSSHLIVLCRRTDVDADFVNRYFEDIAHTRNIDISALDGYKNMVLGSVEGKSKEDLAIWLSKQTYIAQGVLLTTCALLGIDACPMEGFDSAKFDEILGLFDYNLASCVITPVGFRSSDDGYSHAPKVRFAKEDLIVIK
ncbi:Putative NAD(P)H nitroreductase YfkO [candidate division SR1 bacterium Aalborg_AAW-1]|nr:Putative NAD(P)H nitroreductase YfkO [candidate division SR1 bacterium Aalborg_AAW-1]